MSTRFLTVTAAALAAAVLVAGCDDEDEKRGDTGRIGDPIALAAFRVEIRGVELPQDGPPVVTLRVTEGDVPVTDLVQRIKNGEVEQPAPPAEPLKVVSPPRFVLARLDAASGDYLSYYTRSQNGAPYRLPGTTADRSPALESTTQASFDEAPADDTLDTRMTHEGDGVYRYTLAPLPAGTEVDRAATHTAGVWMTSEPTATEEQASTDTFNFVPAGGSPQRDQVVRPEACNRCHAPMVEAHDSRLGTQVCLTCHSPQSVDPDSGNTVDFKVMIHKIHYGGELSGSPYHIVGRRASQTDPTSGVHVWTGEFINDVRDCALCHQGEDADRWKTNASLAACTSCHDGLRFEATEDADAECSLATHDTEPCRHRLQVSARQRCDVCHTAEAAQVGVATAHVPLRELQRRFRYEIVDVTLGDNPTTEATETRAPTVRFRVLNRDGQPYDLATAPEYTHGLASLTAIFAWPSQEYTNEGVPLPGAPPFPSPGQPLRAPIVSGGRVSTAVRSVDGQAGTYEVTGPQIPEVSETVMPVTAGALGLDRITSATVHLEGHPVVDGEEIPVENAQRHFALAPGGEVQERRQVVDVAKCDACHGYLSAHGRNRNDVIPVCVECHNPRGTDLGRRSATSAACPPASEASIDFKTMIHVIHSADIRRDPITICGFGGTPHTFPGALPHGVANCNLCHVNDSFHLASDDAAIPLDPVISTGGTPVDQRDDDTRPRAEAVCTSCHDQVRFDTAAAGLPSCGTLPEPNSEECRHSAGVDLTVTCVVCHGRGAGVDVATVHPVRP